MDSNVLLDTKQTVAISKDTLCDNIISSILKICEQISTTDPEVLKITDNTYSSLQNHELLAEAILVSVVDVCNEIRSKL